MSVFDTFLRHHNRTPPIGPADRTVSNPYPNPEEKCVFDENQSKKCQKSVIFWSVRFVGDILSIFCTFLHFSLFCVDHCIRKKPGERCRASEHVPGSTLQTVWWGGGTRVMGYGGVGRSVGAPRGMGPGHRVPTHCASLGPTWPIPFSGFLRKVSKSKASGIG